MRNKELFFELSSTGKKVSMKKYREHPVNYTLFTEIISELKNMNISNLEWFKLFYYIYCNDIFPSVITKSPKEYSKYFWNNDCIRLNTSSVSDDYWLQRGWLNEDINKKRKERYATGTVEFQKKKYNLSDKEAEEKLNKRQTIIKTKRKETYRKYLEKDPSYFKKKCGYSVEHFMNKGYSVKESKELSLKLAKKVSNKNKKWAEEQRNNNKEYWNSRTETQLCYWIAKGYSEEEAKNMLKDRQTTFSKKKLIEKYGEEEGIRVWKERNLKWSQKIEELYKQGLFNRAPKSLNSSQHSKICNTFIESLLEKCNTNEIKSFKNRELLLRNKNNNIRLYDFTYLPIKKIIEFNGDYWHCNPKLYEGSYYHNIKNMTAQEIWDYDKEKIELAKQNGYDILVIWENDYRKNPEKEIIKCLEFIKN